jgi:monoamine oxidase
LAKGSYSTYGVGQWTTLKGSQFAPFGDLYFAGEHTSDVSQGFMNGAAESGQRAAQAILQRLGRASSRLASARA